MTRLTMRTGLRGLLTASSFGVLAAMAVPVYAQTGPTMEVAFDAGPLDETLVEIGETYQVTVIAPDTLTNGKSSSALSGALTVRQALNSALKGSGLDVTQSASGAYIIAAQSDSDAPASRVEEVSEPIAEQDPEPLVADAIIVTGTKQNLTLQETQTSVELYTQERIEESVFNNINDILIRTPNVTTVNSTSGFSIRGVAQTGVGFAGTGLTSSSYVDNAPLSANAQQGVQSLWDVGQVEILRGPQSTIQGRNALAGAVIIQTNDPTYEWEFRGRAQFASEDTERYSAVVSGPIIEDQLAFRIAIDDQTFDAGVTEVISGLPQEFEDAATYRAKLLFEPDFLPGFRAELKAERVETDFGEFNTRFAPVAFTDPSFSDFDPFGDETFSRVRLENSEADFIGLEVSQDVGPNWTLIGIANYEDQTRVTDFCDTRTGSCQFITSPSFTEQYSAELRAAFNYERFNGWIGAYYFDQEVVRVQDFTLPLSFAPFPATPADSTLTSTTVDGEEVENFAIFGDVTFDLNQKWTLNLGARYDREDFVDFGSRGTVSSEPENCTVDAPFGTVPCTALLPVSSEPALPADFEAFLPRATLTYHFSEDRSLSASIQRGYRAGGADLVSNPSTGELTAIPFDPEYVTNYELAYRSEFNDGRFVLNANVFYLDWTDQQVTIPGPSGNPLAQDAFTDNVGASEVLGAEISLFNQMTEELQVFGAVGLLDTEFTEFPFAPLDPTGQFTDLSGNEFPQAPNVSLSAGFNYVRASGLYTNWNASYQSERASDVTNLAENEADAFTLVNARLGYEFDRFNVYLFANNLIDERFNTRVELTGINPSTGGLDVRPNGRFVVNDPRTIGISLEAKF